MSLETNDPRIDDYFANLPAWQQTLCQRVRNLVHAADPAVVETIKRTRQPYFTLNGNICALLATKDHINIFIYDPKVPDPTGIITQGQNNATAQSIQLYEDDQLNEPALLEMFKAVIARNKAGGWRKLAG